MKAPEDSPDTLTCVLSTLSAGSADAAWAVSETAASEAAAQWTIEVIGVSFLVGAERLDDAAGFGEPASG
jgi:hypothetical protein